MGIMHEVKARIRAFKSQLVKLLYSKKLRQLLTKYEYRKEA